MNDPSSTARLSFCCTADGAQWRVVPQWESILLAEDGLRLTQWLADARAQLLHHRPGRDVYLVRLDNVTIYVKHHRVAGPMRALADLVRGSAARREWNGAIEACRRGIPTACPLALGQQYVHGTPRQSWFVTEALPGAEPLDRLVLKQIDSLSPPCVQRLRRQAIDRLARFVATAHQVGLHHPDFHAGNMLAVANELDDPSRPGIYLIDLAGARFTGPLAWTATRTDLVVLHAEWFDRLTVAERWRFLKTYLAHRPGLQVPSREAIVDQLDRGARAYSRRIDRRRDRRALATNRDFVALRGSGRRCHAVADLSQTVREQICLHPETVLLKSLDHPVKISHATLVVTADLPLDGNSRSLLSATGSASVAVGETQAEPVAHGRAAGHCSPPPIRVALKRCRPRNAVKALLDRFRSSRAIRAWRLGHALVARRIATARPLVACDVPRADSPLAQHGWSRWFAPRESYVALQWLEDAENLHLWAWRLAERPISDRLRQASRAAESLGQLLGRMHARHVSHRDLKGSNLLIAESPQGLRSWLIDTDGVRIRRRLSARRRAADLARLATSVEAHPWVSRTVRWRFLRAYAREFPRNQVDPRFLWKSIAHRARRQLARKRRQGKPVL